MEQAAFDRNLDDKTHFYQQAWAKYGFGEWVIDKHNCALD